MTKLSTLNCCSALLTSDSVAINRTIGALTEAKLLYNP